MVAYCLLFYMLLPYEMSLGDVHFYYSSVYQKIATSGSSVGRALGRKSRGPGLEILTGHLSEGLGFGLQRSW